MARIKNLNKYAKKPIPTVEDLLIGSDTSNNGKTSNFSVGDLISVLSEAVNGLSQDNIPLIKTVHNYPYGNIGELLFIINDLEAYTVGERQILIFETASYTTGEGASFLREERWVFDGLGKGSYGIERTQVTADDIFLLNPTQDETIRNTEVVNSLTNSNADSILSGAVSPINNDGLDFQSTQISYRLSNQTLFAPAIESMTLSDADATLDRIDVFAVGIDSQLVVIEGVPAANPQEPTVEFGTQLRVTAVAINAGGTSASGVSKVVVYDEKLGEPNEWDASENTGTTTITVGGSVAVQSGVLSIYGKDVGRDDVIELNSSTPVSLSGLSNITMYVKKPSSANFGITIRLALGAFNVGNVFIQPNQFGFESLSNEYSTVIIPTEFLNIVGTSVDYIEIGFIDIDDYPNTGVVAAEFSIDNISLTFGISNPIGFSIPEYTLNENAGDLELLRDGIIVSSITLPTGSAASTDVKDNGLTGTLDGVNAVFTTSQNYIAGTLDVYRSGLMQLLGDDYAETGVDEVTFLGGKLPTSTDILIAKYKA